MPPRAADPTPWWLRVVNLVVSHVIYPIQKLLWWLGDRRGGSDA